jgi:hypothetical protein
MADLRPSAAVRTFEIRCPASAVVARLPLRAAAIPAPAALVLNAGWASSQREPPVVEWRVWPMPRCPSWVASVAPSKHLPHQPHLLVHGHVVHGHAVAVDDGHAGRLPATVPERVEPVVSEVGDRFPRRPQPACLARMVDT